MFVPWTRQPVNKNSTGLQYEEVNSRYVVVDENVRWDK